jgi:hypothetical protein
MTASRYTPEIADDILTRISEGTPLRQAARDIEIPESTIREWVRGDVEGFAARYKEARALQIDAWADEVLVVAYRDDLEPQDKRIRADALKWLLSKLSPTRYGERLLLAGSSVDPIRVLHEQVSLERLSPEQRAALESLATATLLQQGGG